MYKSPVRLVKTVHDIKVREICEPKHIYILYIYIYKGKTKTIFIENISAIHRIFKKVKKIFQNISTFCETFNYVE